MFTNKTNEKTGLEKAIDDLHNQMFAVEGDSEIYDRLTDQLTKLYKLREHDARPRVNPDTLVLAGANLLGIAIIVGHERAHVVTSKALNLIGKIR